MPLHVHKASLQRGIVFKGARVTRHLVNGICSFVLRGGYLSHEHTRGHIIIITVVVVVTHGTILGGEVLDYFIFDLVLDIEVFLVSDVPIAGLPSLEVVLVIIVIEDLP